MAIVRRSGGVPRLVGDVSVRQVPLTVVPTVDDREPELGTVPLDDVPALDPAAPVLGRIDVPAPTLDPDPPHVVRRPDLPLPSDEENDHAPTR